MTFIILNSNKCKTRYKILNDKVFYDGKVIPKADTSSFKPVLVSVARKATCRSFNYAVDKNYAYYHDLPILDSDPKSFSVVRNSYRFVPLINIYEYSMDNNSVYYKGEKVLLTDPKTFSIKESCYTWTTYFTDKNYVFWKNEPIEDSDPQTFKVIDHLYAQDKNQVYFRNHRSVKPIIIQGEGSEIFIKLGFGVSSFFSDDNLICTINFFDNIDQKTLDIIKNLDLFYSFYDKGVFKKEKFKFNESSKKFILRDNCLKLYK